MMLEAGVDMYMHSYLSGCQAKDGKISCILFENKNGTEAISADMYIDCTGDGDLAAWRVFRCKLMNVNRCNLFPLILY